MSVMQIRPVNVETGEILQGRIAWIPAKQRNGLNEGWVAISQTAIQEIIQMQREGEISGSDLTILLTLTSVLDFENLIQVCQVDIAEKLGMNKHNVSRSIKNLCAKHLIIPGPKIGRSRTYRLNPNVGWKGSSSNHKKHLKLVSPSPERDPKTRDMWE